MPYRNNTFVGPTQINYDEYDPTSLGYRPENPNNDPKHDVQGPMNVSPLVEVAPGVFGGIEDNPGFSNYRQPDVYFPTSTPSMYDKFQKDFTNQMSGMMPTGITQDQDGNQSYDSNAVGANVLLNTALGNGFEIPDMNSNASAIVNPQGGLTIKTDKYNNVSIGPSGLGAVYSPDQGKTKISGNINPFDKNNVSAEVNFEYNKLPKVVAPAQIPMSGSELGIGTPGVRAPDPLFREQMPDNQLTEAEQFLQDRLKVIHGSVSGMGTF